MKVYKVITVCGVPIISEVSCNKTTEKSIFFECNRVLRVSFSGIYFDDYESARIYAVEYARERIVENQRSIARCEKQIENLHNVLEELKEPK